MNNADLTPIIVTFSSQTQESAQGFIELLRQNVNHKNMWHQINRPMTDTNIEYWVGIATLIVETSSLNSSLIEIDSVKHGFIPDANRIFDQVFRGVRVEVQTETENMTHGLRHILEQNKYLHNKVQELEQAISSLDITTFQLTNACDKYGAAITLLIKRYEEHQVFLHSYIDFKNLVNIVRELAENVDADILDTYPLKSIH